MHCRAVLKIKKIKSGRQHSINQIRAKRAGGTYIVMTTSAHYLNGRTREYILLEGVAFAGDLFIFIFTKPPVCSIGAVPNSGIEVGHSAGGTSLPWEATFLD